MDRIEDRRADRKTHRRFSDGSLIANSVVASLGAAGAVLAVMPSLPLALGAAAAGALIAYTATNQIPENGE